MRPRYVAVMDKLYVLCIAICAVSVVSMTVLIFTGVVMRYVFLVGARFAEPMSIFFAVQLTMYGAAACYRANAHLRLELFVKMLPKRLQRVPEFVVHGLMAAVAAFMVFYGYSLAYTTWFQYYPEFDAIKVGVVYSAIPGGGLVLLLFVIEAVFFPGAYAEREAAEARAAAEHVEEEARKLRL